MTEFLVQLRQNKGTSDQVSISPNTKLQQFKQAVSSHLGKQLNAFQLYSNGELIDCSSPNSTLQQIGIQTNSVIDITEKTFTLSSVYPIFEYGLERINLQISKEETVKNIKTRLSDIIGCSLMDFDLMLRDEFLRDDSKTAQQLNLTNNDIVSVKKRILINSLTNGLTNKLKTVESIASSSDKLEQKESDCSPLVNKSAFNLQKKSSCSASLRNINDEHEGSKSLKHSSIQPYTMHKNQMDQIEEKQNKLLKIQDIKETMSFGSLEQTKLQQIDVQLWDQRTKMFYRLTCPFGCKVSDVKRRLAKAQRIQVARLQILETEDQMLVEDLSSLGDKVSVTYRVIS